MLAKRTAALVTCILAAGLSGCSGMGQQTRSGAWAPPTDPWSVEQPGFATGPTLRPVVYWTSQPGADECGSDARFTPVIIIIASTYNPNWRPAALAAVAEQQAIATAARPSADHPRSAGTARAAGENFSLPEIGEESDAYPAQAGPRAAPALVSSLAVPARKQEAHAAATVPSGADHGLGEPTRMLPEIPDLSLPKKDRGQVVALAAPARGGRPADEPRLALPEIPDLPPPSPGKSPAAMHRPEPQVPTRAAPPPGRVKATGWEDTYNAALSLAADMARVRQDARLARAQREELAGAYGDLVMELLRQAVQSGFHEADQLRQDPALRPLDGRADYQELLREMDRPR